MDWFSYLHHLIGADAPDILWWQMCIRAAIIFAAGLVLIRVFARHATGQQTALGIVLAFIIGSNLSRAITGNARFLPTLASTTWLAILYWVSGYAAARWRSFGWLVKGSPITLVSGGRRDLAAMRRATVSEGDIEEAARDAGIGDPGEIREAVLERNGKISVLK